MKVLFYASFLALLPSTGITQSQTPAPSLTHTRWVSVSGDRLTVVAGYYVIEYRDAKEGGGDWTLQGSGIAGGNGPSQLWLMHAPMAATTAFSVPSEAVAFMTAGDFNDGFATFLVDGEVVGTYDMYKRRERTLVVEGLPMRPHMLEVRMEGRKRPASASDHVAFYGGAALTKETVAMVDRPERHGPASDRPQ